MSSIAERIAQSHSQPTDNALQTSVLRDAYQYLASLDPSRHLFCDPEVFPCATHLLIFFSFSETPTLAWYKGRLAAALRSCPDCVVKFHEGRSQLMRVFLVLRGIAYKNVQDFNNFIIDWESEMVKESLQTLASRDELVPTDDLVATMTECFYSPAMFRKDPAMAGPFTDVLVRSIKDGYQPTTRLCPGLVGFGHSGSVEMKAIAAAMVEKMQTIRPADWSDVMAEELAHWLVTIQDPRQYNDSLCITFWQVLVPLLKIMTPDVIKDKLMFNVPFLPYIAKESTFVVEPIHGLLVKQAFARLSLPLPVILAALNVLITKFDAEFWKFVHPNSYINVLDVVFVNRDFAKFLVLPVPSEGKAAYYEFGDLLDWIPALYKSLQNDTDKRQAGLKISMYLLKQMHQGINNLTIVKTALDILADCSRVVKSSGRTHLSVELASKSECRAFIDIWKDSLFLILEHKGHTQLEKAVRVCALQIVENAIQYDLFSFAIKSYNLKEGNITKTLSISFQAGFWDTLVRSMESLSFGAVNLMHCLSTICEISKVELPMIPKDRRESDNSKISDAVETFNRDTDLLFSKIQSFLDAIGSRDKNVLKALIINKHSAVGFWSCVLASNAKVYQSAANLLYNAFDVEGRLEGVKALLDAESEEVVLECLGSLLPLTTRNGAFEPFPRAVRLLMDFTNCLTSPLDGTLIGATVTDGLAKALFSFWKGCWSLVDCAYRKTLLWAEVMPVHILTDFTRDVLELSNMMVDGYTAMKNSCGNENLCGDILRVIPNMLVWLRLGDLSLLASCVSLVFKTLDIAKSEDLSLDSVVIESLAKYGAKAKKFNNKLTEQQRMAILDRAREFDEEMVDRLVAEANEYRNPSANTHAVTAPPVQIEKREPSPNMSKSSRPAARSGQSLLNDFLKQTNSIASAPPPKVAPQKTSLLAAAKASLAEKRTLGSKPEAAPAAPRPPGFNRRRNDPSDSESSDSDSDDGLFHKPKKPKTIRKSAVSSVSLTHKKMVSKPQRTQIDQKELDAQRMRMRLNVDLSPLYRHVLSWNYSRTDEFPVELKSEESVYTKVPDKLDSTDAYVKTFEPLLLLECWQGIQQSKQIGEEMPFEIVVGRRITTDAFFDVYASVKKEVIQARKVGESDMVALCFDSKTSAALSTNPSGASQCFRSVTHTCLAKIREIKSVNPEFCDITLRVTSRNNPLISFLTPRTPLVAMKVMQMITIEREYSSLKGLQYYDLSKQIIQAVPNRPVSLAADAKAKVMKVYDVNPSQAEAIVGSAQSSGFSLIQGPPGTGKTKTILGIVSYILTSARSTASNPIAVPGTVPGSRVKQDKTVLICAPSNAAVDELVLRLRSGIRNSDGQPLNAKVVRLGKSDAINPAVRDLTLEELVDNELNAKEELQVVAADPKIREEHSRCLTRRNELQTALAKDGITPAEKEELKKSLKEVIQRKNELGQKLDDQRERISKSTRTREVERRALQTKFLSEAQVICSTLSGSAHDVLASMSLTFDTVVIDEAAQCIELSAIIPLRYGCKKCIMVGDPNQLPPTVLSQAAASYSYEQSLFVRMQKQHPKSVHLLNVQYRMHPDISKFPSAQFYSSKLIDGPEMAAKNARSWHSTPAFAPYIFYNLAGSKQSQSERSKSYFNPYEAQMAYELVEKLFKEFSQENWTGKIGIISPYKEQIRYLRDFFVKRFGRNIAKEIDFNTVDGFQGQEKEVVIMSCVRANGSQGVGFLSDVRRMNVALTRSKTSLWILGNTASLAQNVVWANLINDAKARNKLFDVRSGSLNDTRTFKQKHSTGNVSPKITELGNSKSNGSKVEKRVTVPFSSNKSNVLTAENLKKVKPPAKSGNLPTAPRSGSLPAKPVASVRPVFNPEKAASPPTEKTASGSVAGRAEVTPVAKPDSGTSSLESIHRVSKRPLETEEAKTPAPPATTDPRLKRGKGISDKASKVSKLRENDTPSVTKAKSTTPEREIASDASETPSVPAQRSIKKSSPSPLPPPPSAADDAPSTLKAKSASPKSPADNKHGSYTDMAKSAATVANENFALSSGAKSKSLSPTTSAKIPPVDAVAKNNSSNEDDSGKSAPSIAPLNGAATGSSSLTSKVRSGVIAPPPSSSTGILASREATPSASDFVRRGPQAPPPTARSGVIMPPNNASKVPKSQSSQDEQRHNNRGSLPKSGTSGDKTNGFQSHSDPNDYYSQYKERKNSGNASQYRKHGKYGTAGSKSKPYRKNDDSDHYGGNGNRDDDDTVPNY